MPLSEYDSVEVVEPQYTWPAYEYIWPTADGCVGGGFKTWNTSKTQSAPQASSKVQYQSGDVYYMENRSKLKGYRKGSYPRYQMTPYAVSRRETKQYLLRRFAASTAVWHNYHQEGITKKVSGTCTRVPLVIHDAGAAATVWKTVTHLFPYTEYVVNGFDMSEVSDAQNDVMDEALAAALNSYDVLIDVVEMREIPSLLRSISGDILSIFRGLGARYSLSDLRRMAYIRPYDLIRHSSRVFRKFGNEWMQYRYGIMPLVYSYRDVCKTLRRGNSVSTRRSKTIEPHETGVSLPASNTRYLKCMYVGNITVTATVFQYFDLESVSRFSGLSINPFVTAWELMPYSFVGDWFVNIGNYIVRTTSQSFAQWIQACISRRDTYSYIKYAHYPNGDLSLPETVITDTNWIGSKPPAAPNRIISNPEEDQIFFEDSTRSYSRNLFLVRDAQLRFSPSINWKRSVDSGAMVLNQLGALIKRFKG